MSWRVLKFGGSSVATPAATRAAIALVERARGEVRPVVVVSALGGVTDRLAAALERAERGDPGWRSHLDSLRARHELQLVVLTGGPPAARAAAALAATFAELDRRLAGVAPAGVAPAALRAFVLAAGERLSAAIFAAALASRGVPASVVDAVGLIGCRGPHEDAEPDLELSAAAAARLEERAGAALPVVPGFFGGDDQDELRLLGRGGSDTSATLLGAALGADRVEIWTDVDGVYPADPRVEPGATPFARLDYQQAERLAAAGARVLHAKAVGPARAAGVAIHVRNTFRPELPGTIIAAAPALEPPPRGAEGLCYAARF